VQTMGALNMAVNSTAAYFNNGATVSGMFTSQGGPGETTVQTTGALNMAVNSTAAYFNNGATVIGMFTSQGGLFNPQLPLKDQEISALKL
jgi:hypothetical protein